MNMDFIALGGCLSLGNLNRDIFVIDMIPMPEGGHNSDNIKKAVETMLDKFDFDKKKIHGKGCL